MLRPPLLRDSLPGLSVARLPLVLESHSAEASTLELRLGSTMLRLFLEPH